MNKKYKKELIDLFYISATSHPERWKKEKYFTITSEIEKYSCVFNDKTELEVFRGWFDCLCIVTSKKSETISIYNILGITTNFKVMRGARAIRNYYKNKDKPKNAYLENDIKNIQSTLLQEIRKEKLNNLK